MDMDMQHLDLIYDPHSAETPAQRIGAALPQVSHWDLDWLLTAAFMILLMQLGFASLEAGCVRYKNVQSIILKVALNTFVTVIAWWIMGYAFAFGNDHNNNFMGTSKFFGAEYEADTFYNDYANFLFQTACATVAASIMSGGTAERMHFFAWIITSFFFSGFVYALGAHWTFGGGWLEQQGYHDFAGSGVIHLVGGTGALVTLALLRPRQNRFDPDYAFSFPAHQPGLAALGCFVLYTCWLFFNSGTLYVGHYNDFVQPVAAVNTLVAGAFGGITSYFFCALVNKEHSLVGTMNGLLTGLVVVTGACDDIDLWVAVLFGIIGGLVYHIFARVLVKAKIDDPIDAVPVHFGGGITGTFLTGLFNRSGGLFYGNGGKLFGAQIIGILTFVLWSGILNGIVLGLLKGMGKLRIDSETEQKGIDQAYCGGEATVFSNELPNLEAKPVEFQSELPPVVQSRVIPMSPRGTYQSRY